MYVRYILMSEMEKRYSFFIENDMTGKTFSIMSLDTSFDKTLVRKRH